MYTTIFDFEGVSYRESEFGSSQAPGEVHPGVWLAHGRLHPFEPLGKETPSTLIQSLYYVHSST